MDECQTCLNIAALEATSPVTTQVDAFCALMCVCMHVSECRREQTQEQQDERGGEGGRDPPCLSLNSSFICLINLCDGVL